jgi:tRNA threonylcarbamoyladenosine biosynthesis protein TsaE
MATRISRSNRWRIESPDQMRDWGRTFSRQLRVGDVIALIGDLGAGKTTLVQGIAEGWGYRKGALSPTFALANEYHGRRGMLYHLDLYRLSERELAAFPLEDYFGDGVCVIEWADRVRERWPAGTTELRIEIINPDTRRLMRHAHP